MDTIPWLGGIFSGFVGAAIAVAVAHKHIWRSGYYAGWNAAAVYATKYHGSHCGICGRWVPHDPGDPAQPGWTVCQECLTRIEGREQNASD